MARRVIVLCLALAGCSSTTESGGDPNGKGGSGGSSASGGSTASGGGGSGGTVANGGGSSGTGGLMQQEICNGRDDNGDGKVDESCACTAGQTQECYPTASAPPAGCDLGQQTCEGSDWGSAPCKGASLPPTGKAECCTYTDTKQHPLLDQFSTKYDTNAMPKDVTAIEQFQPSVGSATVKWSQSVSGNEIIDPNNGGVIPANIEKGRDVAQQAAMPLLPSGATILDELEPPVVIHPLTGEPDCNSMGWGWGSILYETPTKAIGEIIYLYIGYCSSYGADGVKITGLHGDVEGFYVSDAPAEVCEAPRIPIPS